MSSSDASKKYRAALLVCDMQNVVASRMEDKTLLKSLVENIRSLLEAARSKADDILVVHVHLGFTAGAPETKSQRPGAAEGGELCPMFAKSGPALQALASNLVIGSNSVMQKAIEGLEPLESETIVYKSRYSAFANLHQNGQLEQLLDSHGIERILLTGVATSGIILSTVREAFDKDFHVTVVSDGVGDADPEVHRVLTEKVFPRQVEVVSTEQAKQFIQG